MPGEYEFGTADKEIMEILDSSMKIQLPGNESWLDMKEGQSFKVPANSSFKLVVEEISDYCCSYIKE